MSQALARSSEGQTELLGMDVHRFQAFVQSDFHLSVFESPRVDYGQLHRSFGDVLCWGFL